MTLVAPDAEQLRLSRVALPHAACLGEDPSLFFPNEEDRHQVSLAKAVCDVCPARVTCVAIALQLPGVVGIWGSLTTHERESLKRQRQTRMRRLLHEGTSSRPNWAATGEQRCRP
jgi:WhiB family redox-sensing transcriptional regulator